MKNSRGPIRKRTALIATSLALVATSFLAGCTSDASTVSDNLSKEADQFKIERRIVFYNGITDKYMLTIEGRCSQTNSGSQLEVTCMTGENEYKKHFLGLSDNVTYFSEQLDPASVSKYHYKIIFKPAAIVPDIDLETGGK